ncbi:sugar transporter ERD6-like 7 isoform X2 [Prunus dulcis]|uniref:sugar transporter ERD6-like 7 isoform X2 n=1 Tax=Prunus dulcis TaxID=3755 RepID=UPI0014839398|nr:sugar transporter ERD6-like 7 isoform X2 [Prunus dulcis]
MAIKEDVESDLQEGITDPLMRVEKNLADGGSSRGGNQWMVYLSTFVAVSGSYEFGCCIGYSSPTQSAIREDLSLTLAEYSVFGSIVTFGAMIGAITIGPITDFLGRKGVGLLFTFPRGLCLWTLGDWQLDTEWEPFRMWTSSLCSDHFRSLFHSRVSKMVGRQREFEMALQKLRGKDADISHEAAEIQDYILTLDRLPKAKLLDLFQRRYLRSVMIAVGLMVFQQLGGINGVCFYVSNIFEQAGFSSSVGTITYAILQVVVTAVAASVMDKAGRKPLILVSASGLVLGSLLTAISFFLKVHELALTATPILAVTGILIYIGSFSIGMGAVPWIVMSEIFPINIKGQAGSFATLVNWLGAWLCSYTFNFLMSWSSYGTFILYAAINTLAILFVILMVPETKGKTLEQIQGDINK